jgi:hypothetical protein
MSDGAFWGGLGMLMSCAAFVAGYALLEIRQRQRQNRELAAEAPPPAE